MHYEHTWPPNNLEPRSFIRLVQWRTIADTRYFHNFQKVHCSSKTQNKICYLTTTKTTTTTKAIQLPVIYATMRLVLFLNNSTPLNDWRWGFVDANQLVRFFVSSTRMIRPTNKIIYTLLCTSDAVTDPDVEYRTLIAGSIISRLTTCSSNHSALN